MSADRDLRDCLRELTDAIALKPGGQKGKREEREERIDAAYWRAVDLLDREEEAREDLDPIVQDLLREILRNAWDVVGLVAPPTDGEVRIVWRRLRSDPDSPLGRIRERVR